MVTERTSQVRVSVCLAAYNGAKHLPEQILSILANLGPRDEVIVVDDASTDTTPQVVLSFEDSRIRLLSNSHNTGHVRAFERSMGAAKGRYILLADQDDVWLPGRVESMVQRLSEYDVVATNFEEFGTSTRMSLPRLAERDSGKRFMNLLSMFMGRRAYFGSAMGLRSEALSWVLPIPPYVEAHDLWIALAGNLNGRVGHMEASSLRRRLHDSNLTPRNRRAPGKILRSRALFVRGLFDLARRREIPRV